MSSVSHNTKKLKDVARHLNEMDIEEDVTDTIGELGIGWYLWPVMAAVGSASAYGNLRQAAEDASSGLDQAVTGLGSVIESIAEHYEREEEQYGTDYDALAAEIEE